MTDLLPDALDAEKGLLCAFLRSPLAVGAVFAERGISTKHFFHPGNAVIFTHLTAMWQAGLDIDLITLTQRLRDYRVLDECGGAFAVTELFDFLPTAGLCETHIGIAEDKRILREIAAIGDEYSRLARERQHDPSALQESLSVRVSALCARRTAPAITLNQALKDKLDRILNGKPNEFVVKTGLAKLDHESPMHLGSMPLISGERKSGKSMLALCIAMNVAMDGFPTLYFSLEDPMAKVVDRVLANASGVPMARDCLEALREDDMGKLHGGVNRLRDIPLTIRDDAMDLGVIVALARQHKSKHPDTRLIVVDYAQLVRAVVAKGANREQEVAMVSRTLRLLSIELNTAIILLAQLNAGGETRESKSLEQDCTAMWKLVCLDDTDPEHNTARILTIPFQRNGERGLALKLAFLGHIARFATYAEREP